MTRPDFIRSHLSEAEVNALREDLEAAHIRIRELEEGLRDMLPENCGMADDPSGHMRPSFEKCERARQLIERNSK